MPLPRTAARVTLRTGTLLIPWLPSQVVPSGTGAMLPLSVGKPTRLEIEVTAAAEESGKKLSYFVTLIKGDDATLGKISSEGYEMVPRFKPDIFQYNLKIPESAANVSLELTSTHSMARCTILGAGPEMVVQRGQASDPIPLAAGPGITKLYVDCLASDGVSKQRYSVKVMKGDVQQRMGYDEDEDTVDSLTPAGSVRLSPGIPDPMQLQWATGLARDLTRC